MLILYDRDLDLKNLLEELLNMFNVKVAEME